MVLQLFGFPSSSSAMKISLLTSVTPSMTLLPPAATKWLLFLKVTRPQAIESLPSLTHQPHR